MSEKPAVDSSFGKNHEEYRKIVLRITSTPEFRETIEALQDRLRTLQMMLSDCLETVRLRKARQKQRTDYETRLTNSLTATSLLALFLVFALGVRAWFVLIPTMLALVAMATLLLHHLFKRELCALKNLVYNSSLYNSLFGANQ